MKQNYGKFVTSLILMMAIALSLVPASLAYDEGMFPTDKVINLPLTAKGLKIKPSDIYNPTTGGISEAVIRLDTGCTGEFISPNGLILTNHHCGFDALVSASSLEHDYGKDGYKANSIKEELPAKGYAISIPIRVEDVTQKILAGTEKLEGANRDKAITANIAELKKAENEKAALVGNTVEVQPVSNGYFYYLYENKQIKDIRLVYAPPQMIGFYGGDPDNFEWTRHTGDFTYLRAYVAPDGKSAEYSTNNVPFKPRKFLTISLNGIKENDFTMVMGNPGGTTRYRESQSVNYFEKVRFPFLYKYLTAWIGGLEKVGAADEAKRIALQSDVFGLANSQKLYGGSAIALRRDGVAGIKQKDEEKFKTWVNANAERKAKYGTLLSDIATASDVFYKTANRNALLQSIPNVRNSPAYKEVLDAINAVKAGKSLNDRKKVEIEKVMAEREPLVERDILKFLFQETANLPAGQRFAAADKIAASKTGVSDLIALLTEKDDFNSADKIIALYSMKFDDIKAKWRNLTDLALAHGDEIGNILKTNFDFNSKIIGYRNLYMHGISEMKGITPYPDANFTQRFSYGNVRGYKPREAVTYTPFTTLKGVIEKDTGVYPFDMPQKLKELQIAKDFGKYGVGDTVPVNFLSTNDIIGGNSGSPIMNAYGEQIGIVFDGNYEGLGNDMYFTNEFQRTISVDIRYVLFVTDKFGGAGWILNEMKFAPAHAKAAGK